MQVMVPESGGKTSQNIEELEEVQGLQGDTGSDPEKDGLMHSVLPHDDEVNDGKLLAQSYDYNISSFQPDLLFEQLCKDYKRSKKLYGETLIRELTGYDDEFVEKNINIPEFKNQLKSNIKQKVDELRKKKLLDKDGNITQEGIRLATLIRYTEELERLTTRGQGNEERQETGLYGERKDYRRYQGERFADLNMRQSIRNAIRRGHNKVFREDLVVNDRQERAKVTVVYALDASGSMRGQKISMAKRAGVALAYQAISDKNDVGLIVFTSKIEKVVAPTKEFLELLEALSVVRAGLETDIALTIEEATNLLSGIKGAKHLVLLTDALPTRTKNNKSPQKRVLEAVSSARAQNISLTLIGISLDKEGESLARRIVEIGDGKLYLAQSNDAIDTIILEDYESLKTSMR